MSTINLFILLFAVFVLPFQIEAQSRKRFSPKQRFEAGLILGVTAGQMDGDDFTGYDKLGIIGGVQGVVLLNRHLNLAMELLYAQRGTKVEHDSNFSSTKDRIMQLNFAEVPFLLQIQLNEPTVERKTVLTLETGLSYGRLLSTQIEEQPNRLQRTFTDIQDDFRTSEISAVIGLSAEIVSKLNLGFRSTTALSRFYKNEELFGKPITNANVFSPQSRPYTFLRNYYLTFYASYTLY
ncbi:MAG: PorT family protein [Saprospiraceae bacterium]|nr:PorT family protein [Saprospiraceae bacterium]